MTGPGPSAAQLDTILRAAVRVPDHGKLNPWRFILFEGEARAAFGKAMRARWRELHPAHGEETLLLVEGLFLRAPAVLAVVSAAHAHPKIPVWEQQLSAGAVCLTILHAAAALGFGCQWNTDWVAYDPVMANAMGLAGDERIAGFIYIGMPTAALEERPRPEPGGLLTRWSGS
jgi:nitroreductase